MESLKSTMDLASRSGAVNEAGTHKGHTVLLLQETPAVLLLRKLCDEHGYAYHWKSGQNLHLIKNGKRIDCKKSNYVPFAVPGISTSSSSTTPSSASSTSSSQESTSANRGSVSETEVCKIQFQKVVEVRVNKQLR